MACGPVTDNKDKEDAAPPLPVDTPSKVLCFFLIPDGVTCVTCRKA